MTEAARRTRRRARLARALRALTGGRRAIGDGGIGPRLLELERESRPDRDQSGRETEIPLVEMDQAEFLARLNLDETIPGDVVVAICAALRPVLIHDEQLAMAAEAARGRR